MDRPFFWRWGELNPRPNVRGRSLYRFSGARWLSGSGGSTTSVGSVFRWKSRGRIGHHPQQALVSDRNPARSERHSPVSVFPRLRSESKLTIVFGSYRFCLFRGQAASPAAQVHVHTRRNRCTPSQSNFYGVFYLACSSIYLFFQQKSTYRSPSIVSFMHKLCTIKYK